jgi:hypothetical protein
MDRPAPGPLYEPRGTYVFCFVFHSKIDVESHYSVDYGSLDMILAFPYSLKVQDVEWSDAQRILTIKA